MGMVLVYPARTLPIASLIRLSEIVRRRLVDDVPEKRVVHVRLLLAHASQHGLGRLLILHGHGVCLGAVVLGGAQLPQRRGASQCRC